MTFVRASVGSMNDPRFGALARCGLAVAKLFDERSPDEPMVAFRARRREARAVCADCPIAADCLAHGVENRLSGLLGGHELINGHVLRYGNTRRSRART